MTPKCAIIIPCYNEAERLPAADIASARRSDVAFILVDDASTDATRGVLQSLARQMTSSEVISLPVNKGKGEAVRAGLLHAIEHGAEFVGYWDADGATPFDDIHEFYEVLRSTPNLHMLMGSRVRMLGRTIKRWPVRHYAGRAAATAVSMILNLEVYDTQCGAKLMRVTPALRRSLAEPFRSRWLFDVELIARLCKENGWNSVTAEQHIHEVPLQTWRDTGDSRITSRDVLLLPFELLKLWRHYRHHIPPTSSNE